MMVECPVCRVDGTLAANEFLAQKLAGATPAGAGTSRPAVIKIPSAYDVPGCAGRSRHQCRQ